MTTQAYYDADGVTVTAGRIRVGVYSIPLPPRGRVEVTPGTRRMGCLVSLSPAGRASELALQTAFALGCLLSAVSFAVGKDHSAPAALWAVARVALGFAWLYLAWSRVAVWAVTVVTPEGTHEVRTCRTTAEAEAIRAAVERAIAAQG